MLARHLRCFEERGFAHRDCKAGNILVLKLPAPQLVWIDLDGVRALNHHPGARAVRRALACLHVSLLDVPGLTRTDRVRFLKRYCARFGSGPHAWRLLWRALAAPVARRLRTRATHRAWKRANYGRD
jgi:hypothetical protein